MADETSGLGGNHYSEDDLSAGTPDHNLKAPDEGEIGETALGAEVAEPTKIPVSGPEGDENPATQQWRDENWVKEKSKAWDMAEVEDYDRTIAANSREAERKLEAFPAEHQEKMDTFLETQHIPEVTARFGKKRRQQEQAAEEAELRYRKAHDEISEHEDTLRESLRAAEVGPSDREQAILEANKVRHPESDRAGYDAFLSKLKERALERDRRADELGEWAAVLHDYPPSEAFQTAGSSLFRYDNPRELYSIEHGAIDEKKALAAGMRDSVETLKTGDLTFLDAETLISEISDDYGPEEGDDQAGRDETLAGYCTESRGLVRELWRLIDTAHDDHMTVQQIKQRALELSAKVVEIEVSESLAFQRILEDVRSGKAADPNYKVEEIPTGQMAEDLEREGHWHVGEAEKWHAIAEEREGGDKQKALNIAALHAKKATEAHEAASARRDLADQNPPSPEA